jgi:crotonobetainyl-CoA hydratase
MAKVLLINPSYSPFALPEINVGVIADAATIKLRRRIPYHVAVEFLMTGRWMDAKEANLIFSSIKEVLRETENVKEQPAFKTLRSLKTVNKVYRSKDLVEGATSFVKKSKPKWKGK